MSNLTVVRNVPQEATFVSDSQDVNAIKEHLGAVAADYDSFFAIVKDGDYKQVWGMCGIVPYQSKLVKPLLWAAGEPCFAKRVSASRVGWRGEMKTEMQCKTPTEAIESLAEYTRERYAGKLSESLDSIGGIRYVRRAIALLEQDAEDHYAVMNPRLYNL